MQVNVIEEAGVVPALLGLGLSHGVTSGVSIDEFGDSEVFHKMIGVAGRLNTKDQGHNKFLESIQVWLDITAPRYFWSEFDTYRIGVTKQSESTMHTLAKRFVAKSDFAVAVDQGVVNAVNLCIETYNTKKEKSGKNNEETKAAFKKLKATLPEGFLQRRVVNLNYKALRHIIQQRHNHYLTEWQVFVEAIIQEIEYPELLGVE